MSAPRNVAPRWALHVNIFEQEVGDGYPVVAHVFYGTTKEEAQSYYVAHMTADRFLLGCVDTEHFAGMACRASMHWQRLR